MPWIGLVPEHWDVAMTKRHYRIQLGKMLQTAPNRDDDIEVAYLKAKHVQWYNVQFSDWAKMWASSSELDQFGIKLGDLLVCEGGEGGRCGIVRQQITGCIIQNALHRVRPRQENHNGFLQYVLSSAGERGWFDALNDKATIAHFTKEKFGALRIPRPPWAEQAAIVRFLDHADGRIRRYVRSKQKLITLLEEQKQAIIHQAVTGQIDARTGRPYPEYKSSGLEWVSRVPRHWEVLPLKRAFVSMDYGISAIGTNDGSIAMITMGNVHHGTVNVPRSGGVDSVNPTLLLHEGDLLFNRTNSADLVAKVGIFEALQRKVTFASYLVRMRCRKENVPQFMNLLLNDVAFLATARREAVPSLHQSNLNPSRYGRLLVCLPPTEEQRAIVELVARNRSYIDTAISRANRIGELIKEYQSCLVAEGVTGKLDLAADRLNRPDTRAKMQVD